MADNYTFSAMTYNTLADGWAPSDRYPYIDKAAMSWEKRSERILKDIVDAKPSVVALQELQSTTHGLGRLFTGSADHACWFDYKLRKAGYEGAYLQRADDIEGWFLDNDKYSDEKGNKWGSWPVPATVDYANKNPAQPPAPAPAPAEGAAEGAAAAVPAGPAPCPRKVGAQVGVGLYWQRAVWAHVSTTEISMSAHFRALEAAKKIDKEARKVLAEWYNAQLVVLQHKESRAQVAFLGCHMPAPRDAKDRNVKAVQCQYAQAMVSEAQAKLKLYSQSMPLVWLGDFNSTPDSALYHLLATGSLSPLSALPPALAEDARLWKLEEKDKANPEGERKKKDVPMAYPEPTVHRPFTSAYAAVLGHEPPFTTYAPKYYGQAKGGEALPEGTLPAPNETFTGTLDYIWYRNPPVPVAGKGEMEEEEEGAGGGGRPAKAARVALWTLTPTAVAATPKAEEVEPLKGVPARADGSLYRGMPNEGKYPSDHVPLLASFKLQLASA